MSGFGGLAGGVFMSVWGGLKRRRVYGVLVPMICGGLAEIVLGLSPFLYLSAVAGFLSAATSPLLNAHSQTIWQTQTPRELQGRVFSVRLIAQFTRLIGTVAAGWFTGPFDPRYVLAALGSLFAVFCVAQLFNPYLLRVEDKAWLDELAGEKADTARFADAEQGPVRVIRVAFAMSATSPVYLRLRKDCGSTANRR
jgi:MFS family permease